MIEATIDIYGIEHPYQFVSIPRIGEEIRLLELAGSNVYTKYKVTNIVYLGYRPEENRIGRCGIISIKVERII